MSRRALITGATSQDAAYLTRLLLAKGYDVTLAGRSIDAQPPHLVSLGVADEVALRPLNMLDQASLDSLVTSSKPDEVYNLAAQSSVGRSFAEPVMTGEVNGLGVARLVESLRSRAPDARFYQASSSEMFGATGSAPHTETDPFQPRSPYAASKVYGHVLTVTAREAYGLHASCGILFNHESPLRGAEFVTGKIARGVARIARGLDQELRLGNTSARRDWGAAEEYVEAMWRMLQQDEPDDYVIATGTVHSVQEFVETAFDVVGLDAAEYVRTDSTLLRPTDIDTIVGDATKARERLGWQPVRTFEDLVRSMVEAWMVRLEREGHDSGARSRA